MGLKGYGLWVNLIQPAAPHLNQPASPAHMAWLFPWFLFVFIFVSGTTEHKVIIG
jgi:hypothetical protein